MIFLYIGRERGMCKRLYAFRDVCKRVWWFNLLVFKYLCGEG